MLRASVLTNTLGDKIIVRNIFSIDGIFNYWAGSWVTLVFNEIGDFVVVSFYFINRKEILAEIS